MTSGRLGGLLDRLAAWPRAWRLAAAASVVWAVLVIAYGIGWFRVAPEATRGTGFLDAMFFLVALTMPLVLLWLAAFLAAALDRQRELAAALAGVAAPLLEELVATRAALAGQGGLPVAAAVPTAPLLAPGSDPSPRLDRLLAGQGRIETALNRLRAIAEHPGRPARAEAAVAVAETVPVMVPVLVAEPEPLPEVVAEPVVPEAANGLPDWAGLVRALDFPRDADDRDGFRALKVAQRHAGLAQVLQAAEDVLNLLSQEGVYVDELRMEAVDAAAWRGFIAGVRGPDVVGLGAIRDPHAEEVARRLMQSDSIFRDSALFFQRRFDRVLAEFAGAASDAEIGELANTRSGRAFMLLVRLSGSLD